MNSRIQPRTAQDSQEFRERRNMRFAMLVAEAALEKIIDGIPALAPVTAANALEHIKALNRNDDLTLDEEFDRALGGGRR